MTSGKLRPARDLQHMQITVAVPGIKRLDGHGDQKITLSGVANSLSSRRVAHPFTLVQRMGHMISESALLQNPMAVRCSKSGQRSK